VGLPKEEKDIRPDTVAIYVRWSTEEQGEGTTLLEQLERCKSYVVSQGWRVNDNLIFVDDGYSGATLHRPGITQLRGLIKKGQVDCVVSLKIDRLSRSLVDCVDLVLREWAGICHYKSVSQPVNTTDELSRVFFAILAGFAEYERALIRERTFSGLLRRVKEGNFWGAGKAPYGYSRVATGKLAVNEEEARVVRMIFQWIADEGIAPGAITTRLNQMGISGPEGGGWWPYTVRNIIRNRIYIGYLEYGKRYVDQRLKSRSGQRVLKRRDKPLVEPGARVADLVLVTDEVFEAAQRMLKENSELVKQQGRRAKTCHLLTGLARCRCGGPMLTGYDPLKRRYYFCQFRNRGGGQPCPINGGFVYAHQIEPLVAEEVKRRFANKEEVLARLQERWVREQAQSGETAETLRQRLADLDQREERLAEDLARVVRKARRDEITLTEKRAFEQDIEAERQEILGERTALTEALAGMEGAKAEAEALMTWADRVDQWDVLTTETQREILRHLLERMVVYKPKGRGTTVEVDFHWKV
jgi:site-specific DNA recombinase